MNVDKYKEPIDKELYRERIRSSDRDWCANQIEYIWELITYVFPEAKRISNAPLSIKVWMKDDITLDVSLPTTCTEHKALGVIYKGEGDLYWSEFHDTYWDLMMDVKTYIESIKEY